MATRLGEKLHELRKERGLTLEKLADLAGLAKATFGNWRTANPSARRQRN